MKNHDDRPEDQPDDSHRDNAFDLDRFIEGLGYGGADLDDFAATEDDKGLPEHFKPTRAFRTILGQLVYAREIRAPLALITGTHGAGKTTALRHYAHREGAWMWECLPNYHEKHLLRDLAERIGIYGGVSWAEQSSLVAQQLTASPRVFILDEAQRMSYAGFDLLKYLADASGSTFVLSASPSLIKRIDRWPDISSRCPVRLTVSTVEVEEFVELYQNDGFTKDSLLELHRLSGGVMRVLKAILREIDVQLGIHSERTKRTVSRQELSPKHIRKFAKRVTG